MKWQRRVGRCARNSHAGFNTSSESRIFYRSADICRYFITAGNPRLSVELVIIICPIRNRAHSNPPDLQPADSTFWKTHPWPATDIRGYPRVNPQIATSTWNIGSSTSSQYTLALDSLICTLFWIIHEVISTNCCITTRVLVAPFCVLFYFSPFQCMYLYVFVFGVERFHV